VYEIGPEPDCLLAEDIHVIPAVFEGLTTLNPVTLEPMAGLATHFEVNSDFTKFTFYLRGHPSPRGRKPPTLDDLPADLRHGHPAAAANIPAHWSDGLTIAADDFAYSWKRVVAHETAATMAPVYFPPLKNAETKKLDLLGVRSLGSFMLEVELGAPLAAFPRLLLLPPYAAVSKYAVKATRQERRDVWSMEGNALDKHPFKYAWIDTKWSQS
jgi:ABC-type oligopeptide transport system substrate-binding subunit